MTNLMVSPVLTMMLSGLKRMVSSMSTLTVRLALAALPGLPMASEAE